MKIAKILKNMKNTKAGMVGLVVVGMLFAAHSATGAVVLTTTNGDSAASTTDLLQTNYGSELTGGDGQSTFTQLRNGVALVGSSYANVDRIFTTGSITYTFDTSVNTLGYLVDSIDLFSGWKDSGRDRIVNLDISYSTVAAPGTFNTLINDVDSGNFASFYGKTHIADSGAAPLATGVASVRFVFQTMENTATGVSEIDIFGSAVAVPEPGAALLGGLGMLMLLRRRR